MFRSNWSRRKRLFAVFAVPVVLGVSAGALFASETNAPPRADCEFQTCQFPGFCKFADKPERCDPDGVGCYSEVCP